jgi:hypothetical protein
MPRFVRNRGKLGRSRPSIISTAVSDGYACDDAEAGDENGDSKDQQQQSEGTLLEMTEEPIEVDLILGRLVDEPFEQIRGVNPVHGRG